MSHHIHINSLPRKNNPEVTIHLNALNANDSNEDSAKDILKNQELQDLTIVDIFIIQLESLLFLLQQTKLIKYPRICIY